MEKIISNKYIQKLIKYKEYIILLIISIIIMWPYMSSNYIKGDDTDIHFSNIYATYTQIVKGSLGFDKILPIVANNLGYGTGIFYPGLSHIFTAYITFLLKGNIILALKIVHWLVYFISAIMMYKLVNRIFKNKYISMVSAIFYITFPYAITDVFSRDAIAESFVFMFMPMIILGLYELFEGNKLNFYIWFIIGYIGMLNSHLVMTVYFTGLVFIYLFINIKKVFKKENLRALIIASIIILAITSPFTISIIEHKIAGIYHVFESNAMSNRDTMIGSTLGINLLFIQKPLDGFSSVSTYLNLLAVAMTVLVIIKRKSLFKEEREKNIFKFFIIFTLVALFFISKLCPWKYLPKMMIMLQFAWRLEAMLVLGFSVLASLLLKNINSRKAKIICLTIILCFNTFTAYNAYNYEKISERNIDEINMSYWGMGYEKEYLPEKSMDYTEYILDRSQDIIIEDGIGSIKMISNDIPKLEAEVNCTTEITIELPRIYYLGYTAKFINENNEETKLDLYMNDKGLIETKIDSNGTIYLEYTGTIANNIANVISIITVLGIVAYLVCRYFKKRRIKLLAGK